MKSSLFLHLSIFLICPIIIAFVAISFFYDANEFDSEVELSGKSNSRLKKSWVGYQREYIVAGRVIRPKNDNDTVSEGQAYAMLRALWMNDKDTFDGCYRWTENNLSRKNKLNDNLLAWHYGMTANGTWGILDWNAASDADLDYAFALFVAAEMWAGQAPADCSPYFEKAKKIANDIIRLEVRPLENGELLLLPWPTDGSKKNMYMVNPSYFSPGHYAVFNKYTRDSKWLVLMESTYKQLGRLLTDMDGTKGSGIPPDWCNADNKGNFHVSQKHGLVSSWDAFRLWWRVRLDYDLRKSKMAKSILQDKLVPFLSLQLSKLGGRIYVEYTYDGNVINSYESPATLGLYAWSLDGIDDNLAVIIRKQITKYVLEDNASIIFAENNDYYVNSWAWFGDAVGERRLPACINEILGKTDDK